MNSAQVSIIIPTYNRLWSLPKTIESCRKVSCCSEIIVVDDGSVDGTWEWLSEQKDVIKIRQENLGKDWAVNKGFAIANGKYIKFLDSDDTLITGVTDQQYNLAESMKADIVVSGYEVVDESGNIIASKEYVQTNDFIAQQLGECDGSHYSAFLFKRDFIANIPHRQEFGVRDDRMFILEVALQRPCLAVLPAPAVRLLHHQNERLQFPKGLKAAVTNYYHLRIYNHILRELAQRGELTTRRRKAACNILWTLSHFIAYTHIDEACEVAEWIYCLDPDFQPPEPKLLGKLYKHLGFRNTEKLLRLRRSVLSLYRPSPVSKMHKFPV